MERGQELLILMAPPTNRAAHAPSSQQHRVLGATLRVLSYGMAVGSAFMEELIKRYRLDVLCLLEVKVDTVELGKR